MTMNSFDSSQKSKNLIKMKISNKILLKKIILFIIIIMTIKLN
jgi:hypothetical protein